MGGVDVGDSGATNSELADSKGVLNLHVEAVAVLDALHAPERDIKLPEGVKKMPAFNMTFSVR